MTKNNISTSKLWIFRFIAVFVIPLLLLGGLELCLRLAGVGQSVTYTSDCTVDNEESRCENTKFIHQFFPEDLARQPASFAYAKKKSKETFRIFVLGASAAQGDPEPSYGFSRILLILLQEKYPSINFEVINTAITAINSHVVLPIATEVSQHQADMAIIYLGNNEVIGPFGAGTVFSPISPSLNLIRAGIKIKSTRIGQLFNNFINNIGEDETPQDWRGMEMFLNNQVRFDEPELQTVYQHFQANLTDTIELFSEQKIPVIISTVGSNLMDFPPFSSQHSPNFKPARKQHWDTVFQNGIGMLQEGKAKIALRSFKEAEKIDKIYAELQYFLGLTYLKLGDSSTARKHFILARDLDTLRFRADSSINNIIRSVAQKKTSQRVFLVDAVKSFENQSSQNIQGEELYYEHVHLNFHGNYILAREIAEVVSQNLPEDYLNSNDKRTFINEEKSSQLLAMSTLDQLTIDKELLKRLAQPPFSNQWAHKDKLRQLKENYAIQKASLTSEEMKAIDRLYSQALNSSSKDPWLHYNYGDFLENQKQIPAAIKQFQRHIQLLPQSYNGHKHLAANFIALGRYKEAVNHYHIAINLAHTKKDRTDPRIRKAYALAQLKNYSESITTYEEALADDPDSATSLYHAMAKVKISTDSLDEARKYLEKAISHKKEQQKAPDIYFNYGYVLNKLKETEQAKDAYQKALDLYREKLAKTTDTKSHESLLIVLGRSSFYIGQVKEGTDYLQQAIVINPAEINHHLTLITALARHRQYAQAKLFLGQARQHMQSIGNNEALRQLKAIDVQIQQKTY